MLIKKIGTVYCSRKEGYSIADSLINLYEVIEKDMKFQVTATHLGDLERILPNVVTHLEREKLNRQLEAGEAIDLA